MKITNTSIPDADFQEIYSWLLYFSKNYDNASYAVPVVLEGIANAYIYEQKRLYNRTVSRQQAVAILSVPPHNKRNAGRHSRITAEQKQAIKAAINSGKALQEIADEYACSLSYVRQIRNGRIK